MSTAPTTSTPPSTSVTATTTPSVSTPTWRDNLTVSDEIKSWSGFSNLKDPADAVTQLYNAQKMIGVEKLPKPKEDWKDEQWNDFYAKVGRPEKADDYTYDIAEDQKALVNEQRLKEMNEAFLKAGLTKKQAAHVVKSFVEKEALVAASTKAEREKAENERFIALTKEWGNQYDANLGIAKMALRKFGDESLIQALNATGMDSHPAMIKFFHKLGMTNSEAKAFGSGNGDINSPANAKMTLDARMGDKEWRTALFDRNHPRHDAVVQERQLLYKMMIPA